MSAAPTIHPAPVDELEAEAEREIDLMSRAADYLTAQIRSGTVPQDRVWAMGQERNSIEWDCWQLGCALQEYRTWVDDQKGRLS